MKKLKLLLIPTILMFLSQLVSANHVWDFLRPLTDAATTFDFITRIIVFILAVIIFIISIIAYKRSKTKRIALVAIAFFLFAFKWLVKIIDLFVSPGWFFGDASENIVELLILLFLAIAIFYRGKRKNAR